MDTLPKPAEDSARIIPIETDPAKKDKAYLLKIQQAVYYGNWYIWGNNAFGNRRRDEMLTNRSYCEGTPDMSKYIAQISDAMDDNGKPASYLNLDISPFTNIPKLRDIAVTKMEGKRYRMGARTINPEGVAMRNKKKFKLMAQQKLQSFAKMVNELAQANIAPNADMQFEFQNQQELEMLMKSKGKLAAEAQIEIGIDATFRECDWDNLIKRQLAKDLFAVGQAETETYTDANGRIKVGYVDIINATNPSFQGEYDDSPPFRSYNATIKLHQLRANGWVTDAEAQQLAAQYASAWGNGAFMGPSMGYFSSDNQRFDYWLSFNIPYIKLYHSEIDRQKTKRAIKKRGGKVISEDVFPAGKRDELGMQRPYTYEGTDIEGQKIVEGTDIHFYYQSCWVPNTQILFDYGKVPNQSRNPYNEKMAVCPLKVYRVSTQSTCERLRPLEDQLILGWIKLQTSLARAKPAGYSLNIATLKNATIDGKPFPVKNQIQLLNETGKLVWDSENPMDDTGRPYPHPIQDLPATFFNEVDGWVALMNFYLEMMGRVSGITDIMAAVAPEQRVSATASKLSYSAGETALQQMINGLLYLQEKTAQDVVDKLRLAVMTQGGYDIYSQMWGDNLADIAKLDGEITPFKFGLFVEAMASEEQIADLKYTAQQCAMNMADPTKGGINWDDYAYIVSLLDKGENLNYVQMILGQRIEQNFKRISEMQAANSKTQTDGQMQLAQVTMETTIQTEAQLSELRINEYKQKVQADWWLQSQIMGVKTEQDVVKQGVKAQHKANENMQKAMLDQAVTN